MKRSKSKFRQNHHKKNILLIIIFLILIGIIIITFLFFKDKEIKPQETYQDMYIASNQNTIDLYSLETTDEDTKKLINTTSLSRGTLVQDTKKTITFDDITYNLIITNNKKYYVA